MNLSDYFNIDLILLNIPFIYFNFLFGLIENIRMEGKFKLSKDNKWWEYQETNQNDRVSFNYITSIIFIIKYFFQCQ